MPDFRYGRPALFVALALGGLLVACGSDAAAPASNDESFTAAAPNNAANDEATDIDALMKSVWKVGGPFDYLPWEYAPDGCFDRSFYMSMELASRGIPVREEVINMRWFHQSEGRPQFLPVDPVSHEPVVWRGKTIKWDYHIAAVLLPGAHVNIREPMILDRALEPGPVTVDKWVADANSGNIPRSTNENAEAGVVGFNQFSTLGAPYVGVGSFLNGNWASNRNEPEHLPTFKADSIKISCTHIYKIWSECIGGDRRQERAEATTTRTNQLLRDLATRHLVEDWDGQDVTCADETAFHCTSASSSSTAEPTNVP